MSELFPCKLNVDPGSIEASFIAGHDDGEIGVLCQPRDEEHERSSLDLHLCKGHFRRHHASMLRHGMLVRLEYAADPFESVGIGVLLLA